MKSGPPPLVVLHIPTGHSCNNRCIFCIERSIGTPIRLSLAEVEEQLDRMRDQTDTVIFTAGEPTLNPMLAQSAAAARFRGYEVIGVVTNGRRLRERAMCASLLAAGVNDIRVALVGPNAQVHDAITRRKGSFDQTVAGLENLASFRNQHAFHFEVNCVLCRQNLKFLREIHDFAHGFGIDRINFNVAEPCGSAGDNLRSVVPRYREVMEVVDRCSLDFRSPARSLSRVPVCAGGLEWAQEVFQFAIGREISRYDPAAGKIHGPPCRKCALQDGCPGIWRLYIDEYGWEEFTPIVHPSKCRGQTLRVVTGSPCNNHCVHCVDGPAADRPPDLPPVSRQLRDGIAAGFRQVEFTGGELLLNDKAAGIVNEARDLGYEHIAVETNARVLCLPRFVKILLDMKPDRVIVRLNAGKAAVHDTMARVPGAFEQTWRGITVLNQHRMTFAVRLRRHPDNEAFLEMARSLALQSGADRFETV